MTGRPLPSGDNRGEWGYLIELLKLLAPSRWRVVGICALTLAIELLILPKPLVLGWLVERAQAPLAASPIAPADPAGPDSLGMLLLLAGLLLTAAEIGYGLLGLLRVRISRALALSAANQLRHRYLHHLLTLPYAWFLDRGAGGLADTVLNDGDDVDQVMASLIERGLRNIAIVVVVLGTLLIWNPLIALVGGLFTPLAVWTQRRLRQRVRVRSRDQADRRADMVSGLAEAVAAPGLVKGFALEPFLAQRVERDSAGYARSRVVLETEQAALRSLATVVMVFTQYGFFVVAGLLVAWGDLQLGEFVAQVMLLGMFVQPLNMLIEYRNQLTQSRAAWDRMHDVLEETPEGAHAPRERDTLPVPEQGLSIDIHELSFRHRSDVPLIEDLSLHVPAGTTLAVVGPSGGGKTTLLHLLLGLLEPQSGSIRIGDIDMRDLQLPALRARMGAVFQEAMLFNDSIRANLQIALPDRIATDEELWQVLGHAHAEAFVREMPHGLDTVIGMGGVQLSGGQRQRLAIARVFLKNPAILLLDEATSALDAHAESHVQAALKEVCAGRTSLVIAHRLSTITGADAIALIDQGRLIEHGSHKELLAKDGAYADLFRAQLQAGEEA